MIFRASTPEDFLYMSEHCKYRRSEIKQLDAIDEICTLEDNGFPILVGGFRQINDATAWCWMDLAEGVNIRQAYRVIKEWIELYIESNDIKRLQAFVRVDFEQAIRTVKHLGFKKESIMKNFFRDCDAYLFVRIL